ncbi:hypothetical protein [Streptomyces sp. sk226]|uniref:hypothetical protein n=1 Tax=Streptomyces sp. sk226 TaxID=2034268 RepID=UPI0011855DE9|nr:hypothetical protein [Streptomyces sp. sk226]
MEPKWLGSGKLHRLRCAAGHECAARPNDVQGGDGICGRCAGHEWDAFYVVLNDDDGHVKFGITSGDPRARLRRHRRDGFLRVVRLLTGLPDDTARGVEKAVIATLQLAREKPVRGREYFDGRVLATVLDIVDHYPIAAPTLPQVTTPPGEQGECWPKRVPRSEYSLPDSPV